MDDSKAFGVGEHWIVCTGDVEVLQTTIYICNNNKILNSLISFNDAHFHLHIDRTLDNDLLKVVDCRDDRPCQCDTF